MRFSPILSFYIGRQFLLSCLAVLAFLIGLVLLFDVIELMRRAASRPEATLSLVFGMGLLKQPQMVHLVLPFAVMIGGMATFWRLTRSHELVVARAAGVSVWQFLTPALVIALLLGIFEITAFNPLAAAMYGRYERLQDDLLLRHSNPLTVSQNGLWLRESHDERTTVVHAAQVSQEGAELRLRDVSVFVLDRDERFEHRIEAAAARLGEGHFDLDRAWIMNPGKPSQYVADYRLPTTLTLTRIQDNFAAPESMSFWELPGFIAFFESAGFSAHRQKLYWQSLLSFPLLLCAMVLVAAVFSLKPNLRSGGIVTRLAGGVMAGFLFYFFSKLVYAMGLSSTLPLMLAAWSPPVVTGLVGLASLFHLEDG
ncbi:MAG: LPS export ABC transporter permease LptG [Rhodospirillales bacterium]|nr:LPS export ABC transporter permease LptG [Rhodospirillales bacterium]